jgi:hypothetical protein
VVDVAIQRLKYKLGNAKANVGGSWDANLQKVTTAYHNTPKPVVHGTPANADRQDTVQGFLIAQDNGFDAFGDIGAVRHSTTACEDEILSGFI